MLTFLFSVPVVVFALLVLLPPSRNSDRGPHTRLSSPLPTMLRALHFYREKDSAPFSPRQLAPNDGPQIVLLLEILLNHRLLSQWLWCIANIDFEHEIMYARLPPSSPGRRPACFVWLMLCCEPHSFFFLVAFPPEVPKGSINLAAIFFNAAADLTIRPPPPLLLPSSRPPLATGVRWCAACSP